MQNLQPNNNNVTKKPTSFIGEDLFETLIEEGIAFSIAWIFSNSITNVLFIFGAVQLLKISTKQLTKILIVIIKPIIKKYTYKEGNDKMNGLQKCGKAIGNFVATNPITIGGITINETMIGYLCYVLQGLMDLPLWARILSVVVLGLILSASVFFVFSKFVYEKPMNKEERAKAKEDKKIALDAKKENDKLVKEAQELADKQAKEQAQAQHEALVRQKLAEMQAQQQSQAQ